MRLLVICEDFTYDQHIVKPIVEQMMSALGKLQTKVKICHDPQLGGVQQALNPAQIEAIVQKYKGQTDLFLLIVDRDGETGREQQLEKIERLISATHNKPLFAANAYQEIEAWLLAGLSDFSWSRSVRNERDAKETHYLPYAQRRELAATKSQGRKELSRQINYNRICQLCPEVERLQKRLAAWVEKSA